MLRIDINPLSRIFEIRLRVRYSACFASTRYAHCVSADLYHIEFAQGEHIEFAARQIYRAECTRHIDKIKLLLWTQKQCLSRKKDEEF